MKKRCLEKQARELRLAYLRNWRKKNRARIAQYQRDYWLKKAEASLAEGDVNGKQATQNADN